MHTRCCIHVSVLARAVSSSRRSLSRGQGKGGSYRVYSASPFFGISFINHGQQAGWFVVYHLSALCVIAPALGAQDVPSQSML
jgi:hypothetical protein